MLQPPMNNSVQWNTEEKIIGVIGVAPAATADFYTKLIRLTPAKKDWEHVRVIIDSNPKIPSRGRFLELNETDPTPFIQQSIIKLAEMGADIIAVPCNTAHILYERYALLNTVMIPHMIEVTLKESLNVCKHFSQGVAVFSSRLTQAYGLYEKVFNKKDIPVLDTSQHQTDISSLIEAIKQGHPLKALKQKMIKLLSAYTHANIIIMGCTELSLLAPNLFEHIPIIDSNLALAKECLRLSKNQVFNVTTN